MRHNLTQIEKDTIGTECVNCGSKDYLQYHHIVPLKLGGRDTLRNMTCLCATCHDLIHESNALKAVSMAAK